MEIFKVNECTDSLIDLKSQKQLESLLNLIEDSAEVMICWEEEDEKEGIMLKKSKILLTDKLMTRIKDGRFNLTSSEEKE